MNQPLLGLPGLLLSAALAMFAPVFGSVIVSDSFNNADGVVLDGTMVGSPPAWVASNAVVRNGCVTTVESKSMEFKLPVHNETGGLLTLKADVSLGIGGGDWIGLSFMSSAEANFFAPNNTLSVILNPSGWVTLFKNQIGASPHIGQWQYAGFSHRQNTYALELRYDRTAHTADVYVNGTRLNSAPVTVTGLQNDTFHAVGVRIHGAMENPAVDNFSYASPGKQIADAFDFPDGTVLDGVTAMGHPSWRASVSAVINQGVVTTQNGSAWLKLAVPSSDAGRFVLAADVRLSDHTDWIALAFLNSPSSGFTDGDSIENPLTLIIRRTGKVDLYTKGVSTWVREGAAPPDFDITRFHSLELHYDRGTNTAEIYLNGASLYSDPINLHAFNLASFSAVGVRLEGGNAPAGSHAVDNFFHGSPAGDLADAFEGADGTGLDGLVVNNPPAWVADQGIVFGEGGVTVSAAGSAEFKAPVVNQAGGRLVLAADIRTGDGTGWVGLSFLKSTAVDAFHPHNPLLLILRTNGRLELFRNGAADLIGGPWEIPGFDPRRFYWLELHYDRDAGLADILVDGRVINPAPVEVAAAGLNSQEFGAVGVRFHSAGTSPKPAVARFLCGRIAAGAKVAIPHVVDEDAEEFKIYSVDVDLGIYSPDEQPIRFLEGSGLGQGSVNLSLSLINFEGETVWTGEETRRLKGGIFVDDSTQGALLPSGLLPGYYRLHCVASTPEGGTLARASRSLAVIPEPPPVTETAANPFGAMVYPNIGYTAMEKEVDARYMRRIGLRYVRTHRLNWAHIQSDAGVPYKWGDADREVGIYRRHGLRIIATVGAPVPRWASDAAGYGGHPRIDYFAPAPGHLGAASAFHTALAGRYRGDIDYYEIGNEVDAYFWMGRRASFLTPEYNSNDIIRDYADYFGLLADAIRNPAGNPAAIVAPGVTSAIPEGSLHKNWLQRMLGNHGMGPKMGALSVHYAADIEAARDVFRAHGLTPPPFIVTEIGGFWRGVLDASTDLAFSDAMKTLIKEDYRENVVQLAAGVEAACKFLLREQSTYGGEGSLITGLLDRDFTIRPSCVAYATLVRTLAGAAFVKELNLTGRVLDDDEAWLEGFAFDAPGGGGRVNVLFLHRATGDRRITLRGAASSLTKIDVMGRESPVALTGSGGSYSGTITMNSRLPIILRGVLLDEAGAPTPPAPRLLGTFPVDLANPGFETESAGANTLPLRWAPIGGDPRPAVIRDTVHFHSGSASLRLTSPGPEFTKYGGVAQRVEIHDEWKNLREDEYLVFKLGAKVRGESINGMGIGATINIRAPGAILTFGDSGNFGFNNTFGWRDFQTEMIFRYWPPQATHLTLEWHLCYAIGHAWIDDVTLTVEKHRRSH